jgi:hypothetical protein
MSNVSVLSRASCICTLQERDEENHPGYIVDDDVLKDCRCAVHGVHKRSVLPLFGATIPGMKLMYIKSACSNCPLLCVV